MKVRPCELCGLPVATTGKRGPTKRQHDECKKKNRKMLEFRRAEKKEQQNAQSTLHKQ
jgi:hypothetical protein